MRVFTVGKFNRHLKSYLTKCELDSIDHRLLKGFYSTSKKETDIDYKRALLTPQGSIEDYEMR